MELNTSPPLVGINSTGPDQNTLVNFTQPATTTPYADNVHTVHNFTVVVSTPAEYTFTDISSPTIIEDRNITIVLNCTDGFLGNTGINCTEEAPIYDPSPGLHRPLVALIFIGIVLSIIIAMTILGNLLVILSPVVNRRLRNVTNMFLVTLAIFDLLIGILVLPFSLYIEIHRSWHMGAALCNVYVSFDVLFCTASILNLFAISVDRYFAITRPLQYPMTMTTRKAAVVIACVWVVSIFISFLPVHLGWNTPGGGVQNYDNPSQCTLIANTTYALVDGILLFFLPLTLMSIMYTKIVFIAQKQARKIRKTCVYDAHYKRSIDEHKATKIIAIVMGCFIVCWVPYFTVFTFCPAFNCNIGTNGYEIILWMGYMNSTVNPCLYACLNREFRKAFKILIGKVFCVSRWKRRKWRSRSPSSRYRGDPTSTSSVMMTTTNCNNGNQKNGYRDIKSAKPNGTT